MDKNVHETSNLVMVAILILIVLIPILYSIVQSFRGQADIYKQKSIRYEEVVKP